jgi:hypothetical protein
MANNMSQASTRLISRDVGLEELGVDDHARCLRVHHTLRSRQTIRNSLISGRTEAANQGSPVS